VSERRKKKEEEEEGRRKKVEAEEERRRRSKKEEGTMSTYSTSKYNHHKQPQATTSNHKQPQATTSRTTDRSPLQTPRKKKPPPNVHFGSI
jgi:hypothetical protein